MASAAVTILYIAWVVSWWGTVATTCTMGDAKSLAGGMIFSSLFYLCAFFLLTILRLGVGVLLFSLPLVVLMAWQAAWGARLFLVTNIRGLSPCNLMMGEYFGVATGGLFDLFYAPYYFLVSAGSLGFIGYAHWRHRQEMRGQA